MVSIKSVLTIVFQWFGFLELFLFISLEWVERSFYIELQFSFLASLTRAPRAPQWAVLVSCRLLRSDWKPGSCHSYRGQRRPPCEYENIRQRPNGQRVSCVIKMHAGELFPVEWSVTDIMMNTLNIFNNVWLHLCYGDHRRGVML